MRTYILKEPENTFSASGPAAKIDTSHLYPTPEQTHRLKKSLKNAHKIIERAQKKCSRSGKDKSLLHQAVRLGHIVNDHPIMRDGKRYVNPMTSGDRLYLEEMGTYKCVEFINNEFVDKNNKPVVIFGYK
jgi:hypothetical protein